MVCTYTCVDCGEKFLVPDAEPCEDSSGICQRCLDKHRELRKYVRKLEPKEPVDPLEDV